MAPMRGSAWTRQARYAAPGGRGRGRPNPRTPARPPSRSTRRISHSPRSGSAKLRSPKATVTASNAPSANGRHSPSPRTYRGPGAFAAATWSILALKSIPITRPCAARRRSSPVSLPEPQATSSARPSTGGPAERAARRRQRASEPNDSTVLRRSYRRAMRSNIAWTAVASRSPKGRVPALEQLRLALGRQRRRPAHAAARVDLAGGAVQRLRPGPRVADGLVHVAVAQAGRERALDRHVQAPHRRGHPQRHLCVGLDALVEQELVGNPRDRPRAAAQQVSERDRSGGPGHVERPAATGFGHVQDPGGLVASVDELDVPLGIARAEHLAAAAQADRPVREAAGRVERADDQTRTDDQRPRTEDARDHLLAQGLQRAVV